MNATIFGAIMAILVAVLAALLMGAGHYWAPRVKGETMPRLHSYAYGVGLGILLPYAAWIGLWRLFVGQAVDAFATVIVLALIVAGAGLGTAFSYLVDWVNGARYSSDEPQ